MITLPPELYIRIIEQASNPINPDAYQNPYIPLLLNLCLVNHAFYEWSSPFLYSKVTISYPNIPQFYRAVVKNWHENAASNIPIKGWIPSTPGTKIKALAIRRGEQNQQDYIPRDEIVAILHALSKTLGRLAIDPDFGSDSISEEINSRIHVAIKRMCNLKEYCCLNILTHPRRYVSPSGSESTMRRLVLFNCMFPHILPGAISSFSNLESLTFVLPYMLYQTSFRSGENLLDVIEKIGDPLKEVIVFLQPSTKSVYYKWLVPRPVLGESSEDVVTGRFSRALAKLRFTRASGEDVRRSLMEALFSGELWSEARYEPVKMSYHNEDNDDDESV